MSTLTITNFDFNNSVLLTKFLGEIKVLIKTPKYKFTPKLNGYEVNIEDEIGSLLISIEKPKNVLSETFVVKAEKSDGTKKKFKFKNEDEIKNIVSEIFSL